MRRRPWGIGPGGTFDDECTREVVPGVFFPGVQCEWLGPPPGDPFPDHKNVLGSPMVAILRRVTTTTIANRAAARHPI